MRGTVQPPIPSTPLRVLGRQRVLWILLVGLLAMGGALQADFYMDDFAFILNSKGDGPAQFYWSFMGEAYGSDAIDAMGVSIFQLLPTGMTLLTNWLFPLSPEAAHAWNLLIHLVLCVVVYRMGMVLFQSLELMVTCAQRRHAAFLGALIFACHPLGTEPVHYAKCHMVQLVALFSFWATAEALRFLNQPTRRQGIRCLGLAGLGMISYFPGTVLLGFNLLILVLFTARAKGFQVLTSRLPDPALLKRPRPMLALGLGGAALAYVGWFFLSSFYQVVTGELFTLHIVTQGRVFWEYLLRIVVPTGLASDHYQPWSTFRDPAAVLGLAGFVLLLLGTVLLAFRKGSRSRQGFGLLLLFALTPFAIRLLYANIEIMVEYRAYHALPWIGLLAGWGLTILADRLPSSRIRWLPATALITLFTVLSAERSQVWRSGTTLAENVLEQYPLNNRARTQLQSFDLDAGHYAEVLQRHREILEVRDQINVLNAQNAGRVIIDPIRADANVIGSYQFAVLARAELEGCIRALAFADHSIASLKTLLPGQFKPRPGETITGAWPLLEARAAVERAHAAGYDSRAAPVQRGPESPSL